MGFFREPQNPRLLLSGSFSAVGQQVLLDTMELEVLGILSSRSVLWTRPLISLLIPEKGLKRVGDNDHAFSLVATFSDSKLSS